MAKAKRIYRAHRGAMFSDDVARWMGDEMESRNGELSPADLVQASRPKSSPGHDLFEWDDKAAADAHRLTQAAFHLRMLHIEIVDSSGEKATVRGAYSVVIDDAEEGSRRTHLSYDRVQAAPDLARQVVEKAAHELKAWQKRYATYKQTFGSVFNAIEEIEKELWPQQRRKRPSTASPKTGRRKRRK